MIKVLLVDDEPIFRMGLRSGIAWEEEGCEIVGEAKNGEEALLLIEDKKPDLVLLDLKMPKMDGIEVLRRMKCREGGTKFIVLSCFNEYEYVREAMKLGACDYLFKPLMEGKDIAAAVHEITKNMAHSDAADRNARISRCISTRFPLPEANSLSSSPQTCLFPDQVAMITDGSWMLTQYNEAMGADCQLAELPIQKCQGATTHGLAYSVAANSSNKEAALKFVAFAATKEAQEVTAQAAIPAYEGASEIWKTLYPDQDVQILLDSVDYASPNPYYANNNSETAQIFTDMIATIWVDENADIQAMLDEAQAKMTETASKE